MSVKKINSEENKAYLSNRDLEHIPGYQGCYCCTGRRHGVRCSKIIFCLFVSTQNSRQRTIENCS